MPSSARRKAHEASSSPRLSSLRRFWSRSYIPDWLGFLLLALANLAIGLLEPFHRLFSLDDRRISFPHADPERVPVLMLIFYSTLLPAFVVTAFTLCLPRSAAQKLHQLHVSLLGLFVAIMLSTLITDVVKNSVGRPRPDLLARCKAAPGTPEHELVAWTVCTETDHHTLHDGFRSFPSGHSSWSCSGLGFLSAFFAGQLKAFRRGASLVAFCVVITPAVGALLIVISRTEDYRHDVYDVTTGTIIGVASAVYAYRRYFPGWKSPNCDWPFEKQAQDDVEFEKIHDEEMQLEEMEMGTRG